MNSVVQTLFTELNAARNPEPTDRVFPHDHRYLRRAFTKAVIAAGLAPFRFHDLRHTFASCLAMQGANDRTLMALGGGNPLACWTAMLTCSQPIFGRPSKVSHASEPGATPGVTLTRCSRERRKALRNLERETGFEPATLALARRCSTTELFPLTFFYGEGWDSTERGVGCQATSEGGIFR